MTAAIFVFAGIVSVAGAHRPAKTTVTIHYNGDGFQGKLKSSKAKCIRNRKVKVFKKSTGQKLNGHLGQRRPLEHRELRTGSRHVLCPHRQDPGL